METVFNWLNAVWEFITGFFDGLKDLLPWVFKNVLHKVLDGVVDLISGLPIPDAVANDGSIFAAVPDGVWWFASVVQLGYGLTAIAGAYGLRFLLRMLPWVF